MIYFLCIQTFICQESYIAVLNTKLIFISRVAIARGNFFSSLTLAIKIDSDCILALLIWKYFFLHFFIPNKKVFFRVKAQLLQGHFMLKSNATNFSFMSEAHFYGSDKKFSPISRVLPAFDVLFAYGEKSLRLEFHTVFETCQFQSYYCNFLAWSK